MRRAILRRAPACKRIIPKYCVYRVYLIRFYKSQPSLSLVINTIKPRRDTTTLYPYLKQSPVHNLVNIRRRKKPIFHVSRYIITLVYSTSLYSAPDFLSHNNSSRLLKENIFFRKMKRTRFALLTFETTP